MSAKRRLILAGIAAVLAVALVAVGYTVYNRATTKTITAYFPSAGSLYKGDPVRVLGVNVGKVTEITPRRGDVKIVLQVDRNVEIPATAKAVVVAQSLVSGRFVQLTPVYETGPTMDDGATIPMERTAVPMEWDDIKAQLTKLTKSLGPEDGNDGAAVEAIQVFDKNLSGNGAAINQSITEMSKVIGTLAAGRGDLFSTVQNLQKLTDVLSQSHEQLVQFNGRIASVSSVLADNTDELNDALHELDTTMTDVQKFIKRNGDAINASAGQLGNVLRIVANKDEQLRGLLHSAPNQLANFFNIYNPLSGSLSGVFGLGMGTNLITLLCGTMDANDSPEISRADVDKCVDVLSPMLSNLVMNYPPFLANPVSGKNANTDQIVYQNASVKARSKASVDRVDAEARRANGNSPLKDLLVPWEPRG
ncbi:MCE family protein [Gordonia sp. ABSL1-1]|uniref:MCE family protein n=1 Tax=Gordonia sp. ABSL1-1 TaxID=3053923 RepID=UPI0025738BA1|nr:MCE family protein [Gordonia sp. ABSL1-1]MDL9936499.1 MCE family protein [Gordonia sp. ABSL1-1]